MNWRAGCSLVRAPSALKRGTLSDFSTPILSQNFKKMKAGPFEKKNQKKSHNAEKKLKGDPFVSPGIVSYSEKKEQLLYVSSLCELMIQFGTLKFRSTL